MGSACDKSFGKELRLKTAGDFDYVFDKPNRSVSSCFTILARLNQHHYSRLGLVISKRCAKSAVRRNRLKRLIRESFRQNKEILSGLDVVVIGKSVAAKKTNQEITSLLGRQWAELERRCKNS